MYEHFQDHQDHRTSRASTSRQGTTSVLTPSRTIPLRARQVTATQDGRESAVDLPSETDIPNVPVSLQQVTTGIPQATEKAGDDGEKRLSIPGIMGMIMPDPSRPIYAGLTYQFGFVEPGPRPFPAVEGWTRTLLPILIMPNYTADVFPITGNSEPDESLSDICSVSIEPGPVIYEFTFDKAGWHEYVINQTWYQPTTDASGMCRSPLRFQYTFFSTQLLSVAPMPTFSPQPVAFPAQTVWAKVTKETPGALPIDPLQSTDSKKMIAGMSVFAGVVALALIAMILWVVKRRRKDESERIAFSRLPPDEQQAYLLQNPQIFRNAPLSFRARHEPLAQQQYMLQQQQLQFYPPHAQPLMAQYRSEALPYPSVVSLNAMPPFPAMQPGSFGVMSRTW